MHNAPTLITMEFTCNKTHCNKEFNLKGQCVGIVYSSETFKFIT